jgi:hypothetical protein
LRRAQARDRRPQSWKQMQTIAKQWTLLLGGKVETPSNKAG